MGGCMVNTRHWLCGSDAAYKQNAFSLRAAWSGTEAKGSEVTGQAKTGRGCHSKPYLGILLEEEHLPQGWREG